MTARELWDSMANGHTYTVLTEKQRSFLIDLAKKEGLFDVNQTWIMFKDGVNVRIRNCMQATSGYGGTIGKRVVPGRFAAEVLYYIEFLDTGIKQCVKSTDLDYFRREGHQFKIITPSK